MVSIASVWWVQVANTTRSNCVPIELYLFLRFPARCVSRISFSARRVWSLVAWVDDYSAIGFKFCTMVIILCTFARALEHWKHVIIAVCLHWVLAFSSKGTVMQSCVLNLQTFHLRSAEVGSISICESFFWVSMPNEPSKLIIDCRLLWKHNAIQCREVYIPVSSWINETRKKSVWRFDVLPVDDIRWTITNWKYVYHSDITKNIYIHKHPKSDKLKSTYLTHRGKGTTLFGEVRLVV